MDNFCNPDLSRESSYPTPYATSPLLPLLLLSLCSQKNSPTTKTEFRPQYDYIVVGAGSAGSVVASRLSEISCVSVLLLEAGKPPPSLTDIPAIGSSFYFSDIDWGYYTEPQKYTAAGLVDRKLPFPSGKTLGGTSTLNGMLVVRGNRRNYDDWAKHGAEGWSYSEVLPYFKKLEDNADPAYVASGYHGTGGPMPASRPLYNPEVKLVEIDAILNENYNFVDVNGPRQIGFYDYQSNNRWGQRCSTAKAYLVPAENRPNLDIVPNAHVRKVIIENKRAVGVEVDLNGLTYQVRAGCEVIVSAGAVNTPQLLMLSGIGPLSELQKFNISLVADLAVGLNFQDHPQSGVYYEVDSRIRPFDEDLKNEDNIRDYIINRRGPLTSSAGILLMSYLNNTACSTYYDIPAYCLYFLKLTTVSTEGTAYTPEVISKTIVPLLNKTLISCYSQLVHPFSRGTVTLKSTNPYDPPAIDPNYLSHFQDVNDMVQGLKKCKEILDNPIMKRIGAKAVNVTFPGCGAFVDDEDLYFRCIVRHNIFTTSHLVGTAKMGNPNDPSTVVDPQLRVKGIAGLRVVDASVMPTVPWGNTNIPTIMVAEKASDIIKQTIQCNAEPDILC